MVQIICVNGFPQSGKTTFERYCQEILGFHSSQISSIDFCKQIAKQCEWNGIAKTPEIRRFLSDLKDLLSNTPWGNVCRNKIIEHCEEKDFQLWQIDLDETVTHYVFVDVREPEDLAWFKTQMNAFCILVLRPEVINEEYSNHADNNILNFKYHYVVNNTGDLGELYKQAEYFCNEVLEQLKKID